MWIDFEDLKVLDILKLVYNGVLNIHDTWKDNGKTYWCHNFVFVMINKFTSKFERLIGPRHLQKNFHNDGYFIVKKLYCKFNDSVSKLL